jgi:hypothetical protein
MAAPASRNQWNRYIGYKTQLAGIFYGGLVAVVAVLLVAKAFGVHLLS